MDTNLKSPQLIFMFPENSCALLKKVCFGQVNHYSYLKDLWGPLDMFCISFTKVQCWLVAADISTIYLQVNLCHPSISHWSNAKKWESRHSPRIVIIVECLWFMLGQRCNWNSYMHILFQGIGQRMSSDSSILFQCPQGKSQGCIWIFPTCLDECIFEG